MSAIVNNIIYIRVEKCLALDESGERAVATCPVHLSRFAGSFACTRSNQSLLPLCM